MRIFRKIIKVLFIGIAVSLFLLMITLIAIVGKEEHNSKSENKIEADTTNFGNEFYEWQLQWGIYGI